VKKDMQSQVETLSPAQAQLKLALLNAEAAAVKSSDVYLELQAFDLPPEVTSRLHDLLQVTKPIGGKVIAVGKVVLLQILEFIKQHPFLVTSLGAGAVIGTAVAGLITSIPLLGAVLAPLAAALGITITVLAGVVGYELDKNFQGVGQNIIEMAELFFRLLANIINTVFREVKNAAQNNHPDAVNTEASLQVGVAHD
jgi:hypothetical protein